MKFPIAQTMACLLAGIAATPLAQAQWKADVGAESTDHAVQVFSFLPNEMWVHEGDSITFNFAVDLPNTVTFLRPDQVRTSDFQGCPGATPNPTGFDGSQCVNSGPMFAGQSYTVLFPSPGNYKMANLFHENDIGTIHVLERSQPLPHDQAWYNRMAANSRRNLLAQGLLADAVGHVDAQANHAVVAGSGVVGASPGGQQTVSVMRFMQSQVTIHKGQTVEWINEDPVTPHTITFGAEPDGPPWPPSSNVTVDPDGARHATINSIADNVHSGFIMSSGDERVGVPQAPLEVTRFRVTFTRPGLYRYICALHDGMGMKGTVVVLP
ncbi:MAG: DNA gyrase subunit B [Rhodanobacteraceae bacterium]|jgi:plastocyanin|nr:MAG: DNA gyrase subunit B [Rhodanobacteraceae bacterium]